MDTGGVAEVTEEEVWEKGTGEVDCRVCGWGRCVWGVGGGWGARGSVPPVEECGECVGGGFGAEDEV